MIGVFDSGSGGLTILDALHKRLPDQDFLYLGDHANAPYGHRGSDQIVTLTRNAVDTLMQAGCRLVIIACNTAASVALRTLQQTWLPTAYPERRILGVLVPMVEAMTGVPWSQEHPEEHPGAGKREDRTIALFATRKTVESGAYVEEVCKRAPHLKLIQKACPGLVDAIEGGAGTRPMNGLVDGFVAEMLDAAGGAPDAALLGCTHFPLVENAFRAALPATTELYSQPDIVAASLAAYLDRHPEFRETGTGEIQLLTTGRPADVTAASAYLPDHLSRFESAARLKD
ncbi:glutamate racemase [Kordiimonas marina]|uniref:glutamate racemase n=1 Tax=Kordiimonas marina TaxID=2872312 RepID=UPI001FF4D5B2|nr:aspartate/glutamate racemase family protein [Kordiimonas marina]MCJ9427949.1 aspartate/glutamate racemase family protein [Kordiimonas marina]